MISIAAFFTGAFINTYFVRLQFDLNQQQQDMLRVKQFAEKMSKGDYSANFGSENKSTDVVKATLIEMRDNLKRAQSKEETTKWKIETLSAINQITVRYNKIDELTIEIIRFLTDKLGATQGMFYHLAVTNNSSALNLISCYAYGRKKNVTASFKIGEGLIGQAAIERKFIYRTEIPADYLLISSDRKEDPKNTAVIIIPLLANNNVNGVMAFASTETFDELQMELLQEAAEPLALAIFKQYVNEQTARLLEEVNNSQKRMQLLLENASEIIAIHEPDSRIRYISPSAEKILGYVPNEMTGGVMMMNATSESQRHYEVFFEELINTPAKQGVLEASMFKKDNSEIWLEFTGKNLLNDPAINGILINARDITMRRKAEAEEKKRGQMQALSENSPDFILRTDRNYSVFYVNPSIEKITGEKPEQLIGKNLRSSSFDATFAETAVKLTEDVVRTKQNSSIELEYKILKGEPIILNLNVIPEFNDEHVVETILFVAHDITEVKKIQSEIQNKNKKINDSIQYAERIQKSIFPAAAAFEKTFKEYLMMFMPRDVVSGDFPWAYEKNDDFYFAAVDCTGHGVPGAFMSLIGYFLLNECVNYPEVNGPSALLENLHKRVNYVLKQNETKGSHDGMDVALCMYRKKTGELYYSGAHRPLLMVRNGEVTEYKGNKRPIGGTQYNKKGADFTGHVIKVDKGDSFYIFSDGLVDQIGGPKGTKFSNSKVKEIIEANISLSLSELQFVFENEFNNWLGNHRKLDDVLLIGFKPI